jgi:hypothetical protein
MQSESLLNVQKELIEACENLLEERHTKKSLYDGMKITAAEFNHFLDEGRPTDNLLQKVASHPLINLDVVKSYSLIEGKE